MGRLSSRDYSRQTANSKGRLAQLVERQPYKLNVTGSSPVAPTIFPRYGAYPVSSRSALVPQGNIPLGEGSVFLSMLITRGSTDSRSTRMSPQAPFKFLRPKDFWLVSEELY